MFQTFSKAVHARYEQMAQGELFVVDVLDIFEAYLKAFPEGTNPIFRERTEHDCSCCKNFIRNLGAVVAIVDGEIQTVWDVEVPAPYDVVAAQLAALVRQAPIRSVYRTKERSYGAEVTYEGDITWHHFHGKVANRHFSTTPDKARGDINTTAHVLKRGLIEIKLDDLDTVIDLAEANNLYKGAEFLPALKNFRALKVAHDTADNANLMVWSNVDKPAARFRNTAIGTLLTDLAEGTELEVAVAKYENKVSGTNYKRPTALVTPKMVDAALTKLDELGLRDAATNRRHARFNDVSVNDVLFVDNSVSLRDQLAASLVTKPATVKVTDATPISIQDFLEQIVPQSKSISALVENRHGSNFMSITAGEAGLFPWDNGFSWSYDGDVTDSIKQRVKLAGGNIDAKLRVSLAWFNTDDLDLHCRPPVGSEISFSNKQGILDVDANAPGSRMRTDPVENMAFQSVRDGIYRFEVNQYSRRNSSDVGFQLEVEMDGRVYRFAHPTMLTGRIPALDITIRKGELVNIATGVAVTGSGSVSSDKWGVKTETLVPVQAMMLSPNHWLGQQIGNKHWFFILKDAKNPDPVRGIYNEYLRPDLNEHRKVFEVLGSKTKAPFAEDQLSGLGFSSTQRNTIKVVADGRAYEVQF